MLRNGAFVRGALVCAQRRRVSDDIAQNFIIGNVSQLASCLPRGPVCYYRNFEHWPTVPVQNIWTGTVQILSTYWIGWRICKYLRPMDYKPFPLVTTANRFQMLLCVDRWSFIRTRDDCWLHNQILYANMVQHKVLYDSIVYGTKHIFGLAKRCK